MGSLLPPVARHAIHQPGDPGSPAPRSPRHAWPRTSGAFRRVSAPPPRGRAHRYTRRARHAGSRAPVPGGRDSLGRSSSLGASSRCSTRSRKCPRCRPRTSASSPLPRNLSWRIVTHGFEHAEAGLVALRLGHEQALVGERGQQVQHVGLLTSPPAHTCSADASVHPPTNTEARRSTASLGIAEQLVAPVDQRTQRAAGAAGRRATRRSGRRNRSSRRLLNSGNDITRTFGAASSMASAMPSSPRRSRHRRGLLVGDDETGHRSRARSRNRRDAS